MELPLERAPHAVKLHWIIRENRRARSGGVTEDQHKRLNEDKSMLLNDGSKLTHIWAQQEEMCANTNCWKRRESESLYRQKQEWVRLQKGFQR